VENSDIAQIRTNDDKIYQAKVVGTDRLSDLALIKVDGRNDFSYVTLADQLPRVGDWVLAVGNPFGLRGTVTAGIVSARERTIAAASPEDLIQIDAPINQGDSGGPTFDTSGNVIGVNSIIFSPSGGSVGVSFAIPADTVKKVVAQLRDKGTVTRGWIGVEAQTITPDLADGLGRSNLHGAIVASVQRNSPAAKAGLASGDVITSIGGNPIKDANDLAKKIHGMAPGSLAQLSLFREGNERSITVALGQLPN
jgi:serine protease Do